MGTKFWIILLILLVLIGIALFFWQLRFFKAPEPSYKLIRSDGKFEIRVYPELLLAQVEQAGEREDAINQGFRILAGYIFGKNKVQQKIAMTAPVIQQSSKIAMTAPVLQTKQDNLWQISFVMPQEFSLETLPIPDDQRIKIIKQPSKKYVVIRFSGRGNAENLQLQRKLLAAYLKENNLMPKGEASLAFYNPPWILPFLRRNEILQEIE